jgi:cyanophycinase
MKIFCTRLSGVFLFILFLFCSLDAVHTEGYLFIIGGGERPASMMKRFIDLAQGFQSGKIVILPMASSVPDEVGPEQAAELRRVGARDVEYLILNREQALDPENAKGLDNAGGVFFSGGVQSRLADILIGTPILEKLHELYRKGAVIGGTSAGAAVMSEIMITGEEKREISEGESFATIQAKNIVTAS